MQTLLCLFLALTTLGAQEFEYGKPSELRGLKKVFVDTGSDLKNRERILKELEKAKLPDLEVLDSSDGAEIVLQFKPSIKTEVGATTRPIYGTGAVHTDVHENEMQAGKGIDFIPKGTRIRVLLSFADVEETVFEKKPATNFAKTFIKEYKKANGLK